MRLPFQEIFLELEGIFEIIKSLMDRGAQVTCQDFTANLTALVETKIWVFEAGSSVPSAIPSGNFDPKWHFKEKHPWDLL